MTKPTVVPQKKGELPPILEHLKVIPPGDPYLRALARVPLPSHELVKAANLQDRKDEGRFCELWAILLAADAHGQVREREHFDRASNAEAGRYAPVGVKLWQGDNSKTADGGATRLCQSGFNALMYGKGADGGTLRDEGRLAEAEARRAASTALVGTEYLFTNDGRSRSGYRLVATGQQVVAKAFALANGFFSTALRDHFHVPLYAIQADPAAYGRAAPVPAHHRLMARVTHGRNRGTEEAPGYLTVSVGGDRAAEFLARLGGAAAHVSVEAVGRLHRVRLTPNPLGWAAGSGQVQVSALASINVREPKIDRDTVLQARNVPLESAPGGGLVFDLAPGLLRLLAQGGAGLPRRKSGGSTPGRQRRAEDRPRLSRTLVDGAPEAPSAAE